MNSSLRKLSALVVLVFLGTALTVEAYLESKSTSELPEIHLRVSDPIPVESETPVPACPLRPCAQAPKQVERAS